MLRAERSIAKILQGVVICNNKNTTCVPEDRIAISLGNGMLCWPLRIHIHHRIYEPKKQIRAARRRRLSYIGTRVQAYRGSDSAEYLV